MAVETLYRSSRDPETLFMDKALADQHDKMLELAERLADILQKVTPDLSEQNAEDLGIYMAKNRDIFARAFKGKAEILDELSSEVAEQA
ncbi:YebG family protein [Pseudomonas sp. F1_0610]|uniref:YebG family protein n=1 Tax=Pseudomonas sp. F1_0610 TaxID=3114284 RepID=UPI0039C30223